MPHIPTYVRETQQVNCTSDCIIYMNNILQRIRTAGTKLTLDTNNINSFFSTKETDFKHEFNLRPWQRFLRRRGVCKHA